MVLIRSVIFSTPSLTIFSGVSANLNNDGVALLTPASVAWADRTTATRSVNALGATSSPLGSGFAFLNAAKIASTSAGDRRLVDRLADAFAIPGTPIRGL